MRFLLAVLLIAACGKGQEPPPPSSGRPNAERESGPAGWAPEEPSATASGGGNARKAQQMYSMICQMCHGAEGKGDGGNAGNLKVRPRDYSDAAWQASVTDQQIKDAIVKGGAGIGKSPEMPANPTVDPATLDGLVTIIRGFKK